MDPLLAISIGCFFALFVAALAVAQHVLQHPSQRGIAEQSVAVSSGPPARQRFQLIPMPLAHQELHSLAERKVPDWRFLVSDRGHNQRSHRARIFPGARKAPGSAGRGPQRADWGDVHQHFGDLSDPYGRPRYNGTDAART